MKIGKFDSSLTFSFSSSSSPLLILPFFPRSQLENDVFSNSLFSPSSLIYFTSLPQHDDPNEKRRRLRRES
jgi:hypothetical protein